MHLHVHAQEIRDAKERRFPEEAEMCWEKKSPDTGKFSIIALYDVQHLCLFTDMPPPSKKRKRVAKEKGKKKDEVLLAKTPSQKRKKPGR